MNANMAKLARSQAIAIVLLLPTGLAAAGAGVGTGKDYDALTAARFELVIDGVGVATFFQLEFLSVSAERSEATQQPRVTAALQLRRGFTRNMDLWNWFQKAAGGTVRTDAVLVMLNTSGARVATYNLTNAWPTKVEIGGLKAGASEVLMETVTIVCEDIQAVSP